MSLEKLVNNKTKFNQFKAKGIETIDDLLRFYPKDYLDYSNPKYIKDLTIDQHHAIIGTIKAVRNYAKVTKFILEDDNKDTIELVFFQAAYVLRILQAGTRAVICGKVEWNNFGPGSLQMVNPDFYLNIEEGTKIKPVYSKIKGMSDKYLEDTIDKALASVEKDEYLSFDIISKYNLIRRFEMERNLHQPKTMNDVLEGNRRRIFDELFRFSMIMNYNNSKVNKDTSIVVKDAQTIAPFLKELPFTLTDDQLNTVRNIFVKMRNGERTSSLVQGDVGCGKTMVAILLMFIMAENGYQSVLMAPTNVLANQHYLEIKELAANMPWVKPVFLSGNMKTKEKREALEGIEDGSYNLIIGTHAVVAKDVVYNKLGLGIVDEEHRFGVVQREGLKKKTKNGVHMVSMSATPIPRTLALTMYGNSTDVYNIKTMPSGRKPVKTKVETNITKSYDFLYDQIQKGHQGYIVCPLIEESESERLEDVLSVEETYEHITQYFKNQPEVKIGMITGNMKKEEVDAEIEKYKNLEYNIIISTTIIEVGVNVPNSTVIIIQNSERFGLAQLHQLRGRVGRGDAQSYCLLITEKQGVERLAIMEQTNDGFRISQEDLKLRGLGDFIGTQQSGDNEAVMLMLKYPILYEELRLLTLDLLQSEEGLKMYDFLINEYDLETESEKSMKQYNLEKTEPFRN